MNRFVWLPIVALALGCGKPQIPLPPTAAAQGGQQGNYQQGGIQQQPPYQQGAYQPGAVQVTNYPGAPQQTPVIYPTQEASQPQLEEFEGKVELFGHKLLARRQVKMNANGDYVRHGRAIAWYETGQKAGEMYFFEDKPHGKQHIWYENGRKKLHGEWRQGLAHGRWAEWYDNGLRKSEGSFVDGEKTGPWSYWEENGQQAGGTNHRSGREAPVAEKYSNGFDR